MSVYITPEQIKQAEKIVAAAHRADGLAPLDLEAFWEDDRQAKASPWADSCPQLPLGIGMSSECVWTELGEEPDWYRLIHDREFCVSLNKRYNDLSEKIVGRRLLSERIPNPRMHWPATKQIHDFFEAENVWHDWSYWLMQSATNPDELEALLDRVEQRLENPRSFMLPENWDEEKTRLLAAGAKVPLYRSQRGPITFATSVYGAENLIFLLFDNPDLAGRFRDLIARVILTRARILDEEAGYTPETAPRGWSWADDNCCLLSEDLYEFFGTPIQQAVFAAYSPDEGDRRYQHSDSDMAQLLPVFNRLKLNGVNFGPNLSVSEIREHLPRAVIHGQLAPFTFSRHEEVNLVAETLRDFEMSQPAKGVIFSTAGSINNGSRLRGLRLVMATIQKYCRY